LILFSSAATGGYARTGSDIDLLVVLRDDTDAATRERVGHRIGELESQRGLAKTRSQQSGPIAGALTTFFDRLTANVRSFFVCTRADLLSGEARLILAIPSIQARFVDRATIPSIVRSGVTIAGEDLRSRVPRARIGAARDANTASALGRGQLTPVAADDLARVL
jgi:hypothetical protein